VRKQGYYKPEFFFTLAYAQVSALERRKIMKITKQIIKIAAVFSILFVFNGCRFISLTSDPAHKIEINSSIADGTLEVKSGYFYPTVVYTNEYYAFHIANYALSNSSEKSLTLDTANGDNQLKISFLIKKKKVGKLEDLIGEYKGGKPDWAITDVKIYAPKGLIYLKESKKFSVKIVSVEKDVVNGELEMEDMAEKPNKIKGKFSAKLISEKGNSEK